MKNFITLTIFLVIGLSIKGLGQENTRPKNPKELGKKVFISIQKNDLKQFLSLIFTKDDCEALANNSLVPDSLKTGMTKQMKGLTNMIRSGAQENFSKTIKQVEQKDVKWSKVKLVDIKYEIINRQNIESADIFLLCKYKKKEFTIKLDNCHKSDAWLMMDKIEVL